MIIPCTFDPGHEAQFFIQVFSNKEIILYELHGNYLSIEVQSSKSRAAFAFTINSHEGEWTAKTSGGCLNYYSWRNNPQYLVTSLETVKVNITLHQQRLTALESIGFYIVNTDGECPGFEQN